MSSRSWLSYSYQSRFHLTPLSYETLEYASSFSSEQCPEGIVAISANTLRYDGPFLVLVHINCREIDIVDSHGLLPSDLVTQSVEQRGSNLEVVGSFPILVRLFLCPCVGPIPLVGLTLIWFTWVRKLALNITLC